MNRLAEHTYREAVTAHKDEVLEELRQMSPRKVVAKLEKHGWSREWACEIVEGMELKFYPDRRLPKYHAPQDPAKRHSPDTF